MVLVSSANSYAYTTQYFRKFLNTEIKVTIMYAEDKTKTIHMYLKKIDTANDILIGNINGGFAHVEIDKIILIETTDSTVHKILNPHR